MPSHHLGDRARLLMAGTELQKHFPVAVLCSHQYGDQPPQSAQDWRDPRPLTPQFWRQVDGLIDMAPPLGSGRAQTPRKLEYSLFRVGSWLHLRHPAPWAAAFS